MGKSHSYTDSETEETSCSSAASENVKKKNKFSILKYTTGNVKKKKCKAHSKPEPEEREYKEYKTTSQSSVKSKLQGILKHREKESSDEEDDSDPNCEPVNPYSQSRCLVGRVPRPAGAKPGRGGGVALIVKRNVSMPLHNASRVRFLLGTKEDDDSEPNSETNSEINSEPVSSQSRCLVGRVPRPVGARPGRSRGLALLVKKSVSKKPTAQDISTSSKIKSYNKSLSKKQSY